ncbi:MAG: DUF2207 domain-containing protein [Caldilineaceae bacterium]
MPIRLFLRLFLCLFLVSLLLPLGVGVVQAQAPAITYERYDTTITLKPDGNFVVREVQQIRFDDTFHLAFADIPTTLTTDIQNIRIAEDGTPYTIGRDRPDTFTIERNPEFISLSWEYLPTQPGDVRTFILEYEVVGGLWVYPNEKVLEWRAVPAGAAESWSNVVRSPSICRLPSPATNCKRRPTVPPFKRPPAPRR